MQLFETEKGVYFKYDCTNQKTKKGTIIFVHGFATTSEYHDPFINHIIDEYDYIAIQLPGAGYCNWNSKAKPTVHDMVSYCYDLINSLDIGRFYLIGHSMGGGVVVRLANMLEDRIIALICSTPMNSKISVLKLINYFKFNPKTFKKEYKLLNVLYHDLAKTFNNNTEEILEFTRNELDYQLKHRDFFVKLKKSMFSLKNKKEGKINERNLSVPTLVIAGKYDKIIPPKSIYKAFKENDKQQNIKIELMNKSAHIPFQEQEFEYAKEIKDFFNSLKD